MNGWRTLGFVCWVLLLCITSVLSGVFYQHRLYFCLFFSLLAIVLIIVCLYNYHFRTVRMVSRMVEGIRYGDLTLSFSAGGKSLMEQRLVEDINQVISGFRMQLAEKEETCRYYDTLLDTIDTGLLVADRQGQVLWMNRAGVHDLCGHRIHRLDELDVLNNEFSSLLVDLQPGEVKVVRIYKEDVMQDMAVTVSEYVTRRSDLRFFNLQNIRSLLEENEMEAWQKLVRVLTHEIMNSIAPIISLSETLSERALQQGMDEDSLMLQGMQTIHRRSRGLLGFVENYRKLTRLSSPILAPVRVGDWLDDIRRLTPSSEVRYIYKVENEDCILMMDRSQMEQVLINLLKNATEACDGQPCPEVIIETFYQADKRIFQLSVRDNGYGILPDVIDKIFIPFFTTKPTGSGIGLSLCKQILTLHGGSLRVTSEVGKGSCFTLKLLVK